MPKSSTFIKALWSALVALWITAAFEVMKHVLYARVSMSESHIATIIFCALFVFVLSLLSSQSRRTQLKQLHDEQSNFETVVEHLPGLTCIIGTDKKIVRWNSRFQNVLGYSARELSRMVARETIAEDYRELVPQQMGVAWEKGYADMEAAWLTKDGKRIPCYLTGVKILVENRPCILSVGIDLSIRKRAEEALRKSEESYRRLVANLPDVTWTTDQTGRTTYMSPNVEAMFGYTAEEFCQGGGEFWFSRIHPADLEHVQQAFQTLFDGNNAFNVEYRIQRKDGRWMWAHDRAIRTHEENGVVFADGVFSDVTERKQAEEALRKSEELYRRLLTNLPDVTWTCDIEGRTIYLSPNVEAVFGYSSQEIFQWDAEAWRRHVHPEDVERFSRCYRALFSENRTFDMEYRVLHRDGRWIWVLNRALRTHRQDGTLFADGVISDITERKQAERAASQLASIVDSSSDAIIGKSADGTIVSWNPAAEEIFGYSVQEAKGKHISMLIPAERMHEMPDILGKVARGEPVDRFDSVCLRKDGSRFDVSLAVSPIKDKTGTVLGICTIVLDISLRKQAEREMLRAKEAAEEAARAKTEFLANISHELRTPMNGILGMTELALDTELDAEQREYLLSVQSSGNALLRLISDLLDFSKTDSGRLQLELTPFNLPETIRQITRPLFFQAQQVGLEISCLVDPAIPEAVLGDPRRLRQVLVNLVGNAIKFTQQGTIAIRARIGSCAGREIEVLFSVRDTGIGIPLEKQAAIFEPFTQNDGTSTRKYGGTGLGLTISSRLVELMGGKLLVDSSPGQGSTFSFSLKFELADRPVLVIQR
ncbi:MAG: PAS domain S-box protein [Candidatus Korobacteraceae bacterium]